MKKLFIFYCLLLSVLGLQAQKLTVDRFEVAVGDLSASVNQRNDLNGEACALVRVMLKDSEPLFEGNVLGDVTKKGLQYNVYMSAGSRHLRIVPSDHFPIMVTFSDYGIKSLEGKVTYELVLVSAETGRQTATEVPQPVQQSPVVVKSANGDVTTFTVKGVSFNMLRVKGGTFMMGATGGKNTSVYYYSNEQRGHQVTLSTYSIAETEVTQALWDAVMGSNPSSWKNPNLPVENVSWEDCQEFIRKLKDLTNYAFRLPTEAEWEYAARGGSKGKGCYYSGNNTIDSVAWFEGNSNKKTHAVKTKQANELGLYDMSGNVSEWCQDWYGSYSNEKTNPKGPLSGTVRVIRGGSWGSDEKTCRVSSRECGSPSSHYCSLGLRLAL